MPRSFATCAIGRPVVRTSRTARSRSSSGYLRGAGTARGSPSGQDHKPGFRDSTKPGSAHLTSWPSIRTDLRNAGAEVVDEEVVIDRQLISSRGPQDLPAFCKAIIEHFVNAPQPA
ncbi:DJ-1/PfpI family protein [Streptomyces cellulosae]